jgi:DNA-binding transcriptional MerR regulator
MSWSIAQVARMSGVTSRTLRHYDEIGLLPPAEIGGNGYRYYETGELLRLQQILLLRQLDLGLAEIKEILGHDTEPVAALREHRRRLLAERDRLDVLVNTVDRTIGELEKHEGDQVMAKINRPANLFEGFDGTQYDAEARERWPEQWERSKQVADTLTPSDTERMQQEMTAAMIRMAELMVAGIPVDDPAVLAETQLHYEGISKFWTPNAEAYRCLGQMYVDDERFTVNYEKIAEGLAEYQRDAMAAYAAARLT